METHNLNYFSNAVNTPWLNQSFYLICLLDADTLSSLLRAGLLSFSHHIQSLKLLIEHQGIILFLIINNI